MREDDLLRRLGQVACEQAQGGRLLLDERWDRLAAGTLSNEEDAELRRLAKSSDEARDAYEAFRPLGPEFHALVVADIKRRRPKVVPFPRVVRWLATSGAAAAAAVAMWIGVPPIPLYQSALSAGASITRGAPANPSELAPGDRFQAVLRPETAVRWPKSLGAKACLIRGADLRPLDVQTEPVAGTGSIRLTGTLDRGLPAGTWTLWLVVGRKLVLPDAAELRSFASSAPVRRRNWVALPTPLHIHPRAPG